MLIRGRFHSPICCSYEFRASQRAQPSIYFWPECDLAIRLIILVGELVMFHRCVDYYVPVHAR